MATAPKFARVQHQDDTVNRIEDHLAKTLDPLVASPLNGAWLAKNVVLKAGANVVPHSLGRKPQGVTVVRTHGTAVTINETLDTQAEDPTKVIRITPSTPATVDLLFF